MGTGQISVEVSVGMGAILAFLMGEERGGAPQSFFPFLSAFSVQFGLRETCWRGVAETCRRRAYRRSSIVLVLVVVDDCFRHEQNDRTTTTTDDLPMATRL
jgi:hypothetical protein